MTPSPPGPDQRHPVARGLSGPGAREHAWCRCSTIRCPTCRCRRPRRWASSGGAEAAAGLGRAAWRARGPSPLRRAALVASPAPIPRRSIAAAGSLADERGLARSRRRGGGHGGRGAGAERLVPGRPGRPGRGGRTPGVGSGGGGSRRRPCWRPRRRLLGHADAGVRSVAADVVARAGDPADLPALVADVRADRLATPFRMPRSPALNGILAIRNSGAAAQAPGGSRSSSAAAPRPHDYLLRRWAEDHWPEAAARWGAAYPIETGRTAAGLPRRGARATSWPPTRSRGRTCSSRPSSAGRSRSSCSGPMRRSRWPTSCGWWIAGSSIGNRWHRVVPNFVVQDGDPRGDGFGGPGGAIRDEINRQPLRRADARHGALRAPTPACSQWFINLSPQPHLDGTYTVFGRVVGGAGAPWSGSPRAIVIRTIRRKMTAIMPALAAAPAFSPLALLGAGRRVRARRAPSSSPSARTRSSTGKLDWRVLKGPHVDLYYYPAEARAGAGGAGLRRGELRYAGASSSATRSAAGSRSSSTPRTPTSSRPTSCRSRRPKGCSASPTSSSAGWRCRSAATSPSSATRMRHEMVHVFQLDMLVESYYKAPASSAASTSRSGGPRVWPSSGRAGRTRGTRWSCAT